MRSNIQGSITSLDQEWFESGTRPAVVKKLVFGLCFLAWAFDGLNSYFLLATGREMLYAPQNWLRLATGAASVTV
jgi:hypothetical protein